MLYKIPNYIEACKFEKWAKDNHIVFEELDEGNYCDACPECGDSEFWHDGHCSHCGFDIHGG